jgi:DNA-binding response OmpR family regulator
VTRTHTILVAEEHPATRNFLIDNLAADGYRTLAVEDRAKAFALLDVEHPDLVVVDINGDTLDLLDAVRSATGLASRVDPDTPLIALTGRSDAIHGSGCSSGAATTWSPSRSRIRSCAPELPRCCAARRRAGLPV